MGHGGAWRPGLLAVVLVAVGCAGCVEPDASTASQEGRSVRFVQPVADARAEAWDRDAVLVAGVGVEGQTGHLVRERPMWAEASRHWARAEQDAVIGDGNAEVWSFLYHGGGRQALLVMVDGSGGLLVEEEVEPESELHPVGSFEVDSDEAMGIALEENEALREAREDGSFGVLSLLARPQEDAGPLWIVLGGVGDTWDQEDGMRGTVYLDAVTGEVSGSVHDVLSPPDDGE